MMSSASKGKSKLFNKAMRVDSENNQGKCTVTDEVGEIFTAAGTAFTKLGELTLQLHTASGGGSTKWTEEDIAMMHNCLTKFASEIDEISNRVKLRAMTPVNTPMKKKEIEVVDLSPSSPLQLNSSILSTPPSIAYRRGAKKFYSSSCTPPSATHVPPHGQSSVPPYSNEVTLNMLNASSSSDGDTDLKMDYDSSPDAT